MGRKKNKNISSVNHAVEDKLLISKHEEEIVKSVKSNKITIITGQTGCGKSTQVPQYLYNSGYFTGQIFCLHPKCIAAMTLSKWVATEMNSKVGKYVGYAVRFYKSDLCPIMFMTVGYFLRMLTNTNISGNNVVIIDEAHERCFTNDLIMAKMKTAMTENNNLKLIIMSATLDVDILKKYYNTDNVIQVDPKPDRVKILYNPSRTSDYVAHACFLVMEILKNSSSGHILIFLPSEQKVRLCKNEFKKHEASTKNCVVLKLFSNMDYHDKLKVFQNYEYMRGNQWFCKRKIIISTNVAETSLTIDDIQFVVDSGWVKRVKYNPLDQVEYWTTELVSEAEANQRKGRAGRTINNKVKQPLCYRMFEEQIISPEKILNIDYNSHYFTLSEKSENPKSQNKTTNANKVDRKTTMVKYPDPEIYKTNLQSVIMFMNNVKMTPINQIDLISPIIIKELNQSIKLLVDQLILQNIPPHFLPTHLGWLIAPLPLEPDLGKVLYFSSIHACLDEVSIILSFVTQPDVTFKTNLFQFDDPNGDLFRYLNIFNNVAHENSINSPLARQYCKDNGLNYSTVKYAYLTYVQLFNSLSSNQSDYHFRPRTNAKLVNRIIYCFISGFFKNIAVACDSDNKSMKNHRCFKIVKRNISGYLIPNSCIPKECDIILFTSARNNERNTWFRNCIALDMNILNNFPQKNYKVDTSLWHSILDEVKALLQEASTIGTSTKAVKLKQKPVKDITFSMEMLELADRGVFTC